jgi:hypothetical protein
VHSDAEYPASGPVLSRWRGAALVKYVKGQGPGVGLFYEVRDRLYDDRPFAYELVVVDEAHRIPGANPKRASGEFTQLEAVLRAGRVVVCLIDEGQVLNEDDAGNRTNFVGTWQRVRSGGRTIDLTLTEQYRLPAGQAEWLKRFLEGEICPPCTDYEMQICRTPGEVIESLLRTSQMENAVFWRPTPE